MIISFPQVTFSRKELKGWLEYKDPYVGVNEDGTTDNYIPAGEKVSIILTFEGNYLGGEVNTELSAPVSIMFGQRLAPKTTEELEDYTINYFRQKEDCEQFSVLKSEDP